MNVRKAVVGDYDQVLALSNQNKRYLGLLPKTAILESIRSGRVVAAFEDDRLQGYVLYDLPYADIRIVQLCVAKEYQGRGVARALIDHVVWRHSDRQCIRLKCRKDYPANSIWPVLGFEEQGRGPGRGKDGGILVSWRRAILHQDLLSLAYDQTTKIRAALDTNAAIDYLARPDGPGHQYLSSQLIADEIAFCATRTVVNEISNIKDDETRELVQRRLAQLGRPAVDLGVAESVREDVIARIPPAELSRDPSLEEDAKIASEAIAAGMDLIVTGDDNALRVLGPVLERMNLIMLHPSQIALRIEEIEGSKAYAYGRLQQTKYTWSRYQSGNELTLGHLLANDVGERRKNFLDLVRRHGATLEILTSADSGIAESALSKAICENRIVIGLFRIRQSPNQQTILRQLLFQLRVLASSVGVNKVEFGDPAMCDGIMASALKREGAIREGDVWIMNVLDEIVPRSEYLDKLDLRVQEKDIPLTPSDAEEIFWPLKVVEAGIPNYLVPIKQNFASRLLGYDEPLLDREDHLGMARHHVYYKHPRGRPKAPGRILWYVSGRREGYVVAASRLVGTFSATPRTLYSKFGDFGVWTRGDIEGSVGDDGKALALRFADTMVFERRVGLKDLRTMFESEGCPMSLMTTTKIPESLFIRIYRAGRGAVG